MQALRHYLLAVQFFSRIPVAGRLAAWVGWSPEMQRASAAHLPGVGWLVGLWAALLLAALLWLLPASPWSPLAAALISTAGTLWLTGGFHEDGLADVADGLGGLVPAERALEIMKDSRIGAYGAIGIICLLGTKCTTLSMLPPLATIAALLVAHPLSRLMATSLIWRLDYARAEGKAKPLAQKMSTIEFLLAAVTAAIPALAMIACGWLTWSALATGIVAALIATIWLARKFVHRIAGYTGDCLGAVQQLSEVVFYLCVLASMHHGALPW